MPDPILSKCFFPSNGSQVPDVIFFNYGAWSADGAQPDQFDTFRLATAEAVSEVRDFLSAYPTVQLIWATTHPFSHEHFSERVRTNQRIQVFNLLTTVGMLSTPLDVFDSYAMAFPRLDATCDAGSHFHCNRGGGRPGGVVGFQELQVLASVLYYGRLAVDRTGEV